jgi:hypothetical protein
VNKALVLALGVGVLASPALSQGSFRSDERDGYSTAREGGRGSWREDRAGRDMRDDERSAGRRGGDEERSDRPARGGARFMVRSGDARVAVRCDERESMRACVDATTTLLERVRSQSAGSASGPTSSPAAPATPR